MQLLYQPIAQCANMEDRATGKFFEARFQATRLQDETSPLGLCRVWGSESDRGSSRENLEGSPITPIKRRVEDLKSVERHGGN